MEKAKLLFCNAYFYRYDKKQWETGQPYPPYGTLYAASHMRTIGYDVAFFDNNLIKDHKEIYPVIEKEKPDYLVIYDDGFNYLTKMCLTNMREAAYEIATWAKQKGIRTIVSSSDSTDHYEDYLKNGIDFVIMGEAEMTLSELVEKLEDGVTDYTTIKGLSFINDADIMKTIKRPVLRELDSLPDPAWDLVDLKPYKEIWEQNNGYFMLNIATTRGCPFKCNWCAKPIYGNRYNTRSPERVSDEIAMLNREYGVSKFWMADDIFGLKPGWVQKFRDCLNERNLKIEYKIQSRVDLLLQEDTIDALAESGLHEVWVGAESGSQRILDMMDKGTKVEQIYEATKLLKKKGVRVAFFLQFGYMDESREEIEKTINMVKDLVPDNIGVSVSYPLPGTKFYDIVVTQMQDKFNWSDSDDLSMMYEGSFDSSFYKRLHRYVHKVFRTRQGVENLKSLLSNPVKGGYPKWRSALATAYYYPGSIIDGIRLKQLEKAGKQA